MLLLSMQTQYGGNRQYRREHYCHAHKSPRLTAVRLLDAASPNKITRALVSAITEVFVEAAVDRHFLQPERLTLSGASRGRGQGWRMTEIVTGIKLMAVSRRLKLALLIVVIAAMVYVLVSPLPELAATSTLNFPVAPLIIVLLVPNLLETARTPAVQIADVWLDEDLPSRNCALLC